MEGIFSEIGSRADQSVEPVSFAGSDLERLRERVNNVKLA